MSRRDFIRKLDIDICTLDSIGFENNRAKMESFRKGDNNVTLHDLFVMTIKRPPFFHTL